MSQCCRCCYNVRNSIWPSAIFRPISAYDKPQSISAGQTYCTFSLLLFALLLLVNVTLLWGKYAMLLLLYVAVIMCTCKCCMCLLLCGMLWLVNVTKKCFCNWVSMLLLCATGLSMHFHALHNGFITVAR